MFTKVLLKLLYYGLKRKAFLMVRSQIWWSYSNHYSLCIWSELLFDWDIYTIRIKFTTILKIIIKIWVFSSHSNRALPFPSFPPTNLEGFQHSQGFGCFRAGGEPTILLWCLTCLICKSLFASTCLSWNVVRKHAESSHFRFKASYSYLKMR